MKSANARLLDMSCSGDILANSADQIDVNARYRDTGMFQQRRDVIFALNLAPSQKKHINCAFLPAHERKLPRYVNDPYKKSIPDNEFNFADQCPFLNTFFWGGKVGVEA